MGAHFLKLDPQHDIRTLAGTKYYKLYPLHAIVATTNLIKTSKYSKSKLPVGMGVQ